jgi:hypothetical protein
LVCVELGRHLLGLMGGWVGWVVWFDGRLGCLDELIGLMGENARVAVNGACAWGERVDENEMWCKGNVFIYLLDLPWRRRRYPRRGPACVSGWLVGLFDSMVGSLAGWLVGWLVGWLLGSVVGEGGMQQPQQPPTTAHHSNNAATTTAAAAAAAATTNDRAHRDDVVEHVVEGVVPGGDHAQDAQRAVFHVGGLVHLLEWWGGGGLVFFGLGEGIYIG